MDIKQHTTQYSVGTTAIADWATYVKKRKNIPKMIIPKMIPIEPTSILNHQPESNELPEKTLLGAGVVIEIHWDHGAFQIAMPKTK